MTKFAAAVQLEQFHKDFQGEPFPYFQPIISMEDRKVIGYEVLARGFNKEGKVATLGPLFQIPGSFEYVKKIDFQVREEAFKKFSGSGLIDGRKLFINIMPKLLEVQSEGAMIEELTVLKEMTAYYKIPTGSVVLEITEGEFSSRPEEITMIANELKDAGYEIALDDFGAGFSNLSRIGQLKPKYIKLDLSLIRRGFTESFYKEILNSMSYLSDRIGAILLVEGIETQEELYGAMDIGARHIQGFLLGFPAQEFQDLPIREGNLDDYLKSFRKHKIDHMKGLLSFQSMLADDFTSNLQARFEPSKSEKETWELASSEPYQLPQFWKDQLKLVYFLDFSGVQVSPNYTITLSGDLENDESFVGKDWSWRPYFLEFMAKKTAYGRNLTYSEPYRDIRVNGTMVTMLYSYFDEVIICLDLEISDLTDPLWHLKLSKDSA